MFGWWRKRSKVRQKAPQRPPNRPWLEPLEDRMVPAVYTVDRLGDIGAGAGNSGDIRYVIDQSNASVGVADQIHFNILGGGPQFIMLTMPLPTITDPVIIDGGTQPLFGGTPIIILDGLFFANGLEITAGNTTVRSLVIHNFFNGIDISGGGGNHIENNYIGTDASGTVALANGGSGIVIHDSSDNVIGGDVPGTGNLISGNQEHGIEIWGTEAQRNSIRRNIIGADITGTAKVPNGKDGVHLEFGARNNTIGGDYSTQGNLISGNTLNGIAISGSGTLGNKVFGNHIGTKMWGLEALGNGQNGVLIEDGASSNEIGQSWLDNTYNVISGNDQRGVHIKDSTTTLNKVRGNYIGLGADGDTKVGNQGSAGVMIENAPDNTIGGDSTLGQGNVISGNAGDGIQLVDTDPVSNDVVSNDVLGNIIGLGGDGNVERGNGGDGVHVSGAHQTVIGGTSGEANRNIISGNGDYGIYIYLATFTEVKGNYIGTDKSGEFDRGNKEGGITVEDAEDTTIGGLVDGARNIISGNDGGNGPLFGNGIAIVRGSERTTVQKNYIGTDVDGLEDLGNARSGIYIEATSSDNTIGGTAAAAGNVVSGNGWDGIEVDGDNNFVDYNYVGYGSDGMTKLENDEDQIDNNGQGNTIGTHNLVLPPQP